MAPPPGIFLSGYYGAGNLGDDLLVRAAAEGISAYLPRAQFYVRNLGGIPTLEGMPSVHLTDIDRILADARRSRVARALRYLRAHWKYLGRCRFLVLGGGTMIQGGPFVGSLILLTMICGLARLRGVQVVGIGLGIAPLRHALPRWCLRTMVSLSRAFCVRDQAAVDECRQAGCRSVTLTADLAYGLGWLPVRAGSARREEARTLGISLYEDCFIGPGATQRRDHVLGVVAQVVEERLRMGWHVCLLSVQHVLLPNGRPVGDGRILVDLRDRLPSAFSGHVCMRSLVATAESIGETYSCLSVLISMTFHALVLAGLHGVPFVGLSHDHKIAEICRVYEMPCRPLEHLQPEWLAGAADECLGRPPSAAVTRDLVQRARENYRFLDSLASRISA